jgi:hypothetical protein
MATPNWSNSPNSGPSTGTSTGTPPKSSAPEILFKEIQFILLILSKPPFHQPLPPFFICVHLRQSVAEINLQKKRAFSPSRFFPLVEM